MTRRKGLTRKTPWEGRGAPLKRRAQLKPRSDRKAAEVAEYRAEKERRMAAQIAERGHTFCQRCDNPRPVDGHHPGGQNTRDRILTFFLICRLCHDHIHFREPAQARLDGWLTS